MMPRRDDFLTDFEVLANEVGELEDVVPSAVLVPLWKPPLMDSAGTVFQPITGGAFEEAVSIQCPVVEQQLQQMIEGTHLRDGCFCFLLSMFPNPPEELINIHHVVRVDENW